MATDALFAEMEKVGQRMPEFVNNWPGLARNMVKKSGKVTMVSERDFRSTFLLQDGGRTGVVDMNGGAIGLGTAQKGGVMIQTAQDLRINFQLTQRMIDATDDAEKSRLNAFRRAIQQAPKKFAQFLDRVFHGDGTAILGTATAQATVSSKTRYTMDTVTSLNKVRVGDYVIPYNSSGAALNSGVAVFIEQLDFENRYVYLSALIASAAAGDTLDLDGVTGSSPTTVQGIYYFITDSTSGSTLGVSRATTWEIVSNSVDVGGGVPTVMKGMQLLDKMLTRRGEQSVEGLTWLIPTPQRANLYSNVQQISRIDSFDGNLNKDLNKNAGDMTINFCGHPGRVDLFQDTNRIDAFVAADYERVEIAPVRQYEVGGVKIFSLVDSTTGAPKAAQWFSYYVTENYVCVNPGNAGYLKNCGLPTY